MKERFFRYTQREQNLLGQARNFVDLRVYMHLKEKVDFESGRLEHPSALRLTTSTIAREISLPATQGEPALTISRHAVKRSLERLEVLGLMDEIDRSGKFLRLRLPMVAANTRESDTEQKKSARNCTENGEKPARKSARTESSETVAAQGFQDTHIGKSARKSARTCTENGEKSARTENDESSEIVAAQGFAGSNVVPLKIEKQSIIKSPPFPPEGGEENLLPSASEKPTPLAADGGSQEESEKTKPEIRRLRKLVADAAKACGGVIRCLNSPQSTEVIESWIPAGFKDFWIQDAVKLVVETPGVKPFVNAVDEVMRKWAANMQKKSLCL